MKKITKLPLNWPTDKRTKRADSGDAIIITHPDRAPHWSEDGRTWQEVRINEDQGSEAKVHYL